MFVTLVCSAGAGVAGGVGTSSSGPDTSGNDFTRSFRKSNRLSDRIHCFLQTNTRAVERFIEKRDSYTIILHIIIER